MSRSSILLYLNYLGIYNFHKAINASEKFSTICDLIDSSASELSNIGFNNKQIYNIKNLYSDYSLYKEKIKSKDVIIIDYFDKKYPDSLKSIYSPPPTINCIGNVDLLSKSTTGIVGSRKASAEGKKFSYELAKTASRAGITVVSGLAYGIDTQAHIGALEGSGSTIAVLGSGIDKVYPQKNFELYVDISKTGLIISEYPLGTDPKKFYFPARNRIISGLSSSISIIEASKKSGSLITSEYALEQGKEIFSVPGSVYSQKHKGSNSLLKSGAIPLLSPDDFLDFYNLEIEKISLSTDNLSPLEHEVLMYIESNQPIEEESIFYNIDLPHGEISSVLTILEIDGYIEKLTPTIYIKK